VSGGVYSERFCALWNSTATQRFVVPAGYRAIVMTVTAQSAAAAAMAVGAYIENVGCIAWLPFTGSNQGAQNTNLRQVARSGETLMLTATGLAYAVMSGYLLQSTPSRESIEFDESEDPSPDSLPPGLEALAGGPASPFG
jgi:hypothetical protein